MKHVFTVDKHNFMNPLQIKIFYFQEKLQNFSYLIHDGDTAYVVDPYEADSILEFSQKHQLQILGILNTHDHFDHIRGNDQIIQKTQCALYDGNIELNWKNHRIQSYFTPGHCSKHYVYSFNHKHFFMGDLLFQGGVGRCFSDGDPVTLALSLINMMKIIPIDALWYPGHDYWTNNYKFAAQFDFFQSLVANLPPHQQGHLAHNQFSFERQNNIFLWCLNNQNWNSIDHEIKGNNSIECFRNLRAKKDLF